MATLTEQIETCRTEPARATRAFKRILVEVGSDQRSAQRIKIAVDLATRFTGRVVGVYAAKAILPPAIAMGALPPAFFADHENLVQEDADIALRQYLDHVVRAGLEGDWHCIREASGPTLRQLARYMDLTVVGQTDPMVAEGLVAVRPEELALGSGRPVLVVPYVSCSLNPGKRVVIAWDGSREAARAMADALPLLGQASSVWVVSIDAKVSDMSDGAKPAEDLCDFLADHGISAKPDHLQTDECSEADVLLSRIADFGADLLIMGCYGHTRLRELVLGGVTREILAHMTVPVFMSH